MSPLKQSKNLAARMGRWSAGHRKTAIFGWLAFVIASFAIGAMVGMQTIDKLTPREREVLELMAEGRSNQAIADAMFVTLRAVEKHVTNIFEKLDLSASPDDHRRVLAVLSLLRA